jgi:hypothetical protein
MYTDDFLSRGFLSWLQDGGSKKNEEKVCKVYVTKYFFARFLCLFGIIMDKPCVNNAKQIFLFSIVVAISHDILHIGF